MWMALTMNFVVAWLHAPRGVFRQGRSHRLGMPEAHLYLTFIHFYSLFGWVGMSAALGNGKFHPYSNFQIPSSIFQFGAEFFPRWAFCNLRIYQLRRHLPSYIPVPAFSHSFFRFNRLRMRMNDPKFVLYSVKRQ
jgi:hypothetical protein